MFEVLYIDDIADDETLDKKAEEGQGEKVEDSQPLLRSDIGKQRSKAGTASTRTSTTFTIPKTRHVSVVSTGNRVQRHNLTCFRCGGPHHFRSECSSFRTKLCSQWKVGCCQEAYCPFAHGTEALRRPWLIQEEATPRGILQEDNLSRRETL